MFLPSSLGMVKGSVPLAAVDESLWYPAEPPVTVTANSEPTTIGVNHGVMVTITVPGDCHSICYYRVADTMETSGTVALWQISGQTVEVPNADVLLDEVDFSGHSGTGWKVIPLTAPQALLPSKAYVAHIFFASSGTQVIEPVTAHYFTNSSRTSEPWGFLNAPVSNGQFDPRGFTKRNGLIAVGAFQRPVDPYNGTNFWVDVIVNARPVPLPPPFPLTLKWPIPDGWPTFDNTGPDPEIELTVVLDPASSTADDEIIENKDFRQGLTLQHSGVTVRNCLVQAAVYGITVNPDTTGTLIEDCRINMLGRNNAGAGGIAFGGTEVTVQRCDIYNCENGTTCFGHPYPVNIIFRDNFIHHLRASPGFPHFDGMQFDGGQTNVEITHNTIMNEHYDTAALMIDNYGGPSDNFLIQDNYLCGASYTCYCDESFNPAYPLTNIRYLDNKLVMGAFGYFNATSAEPPTFQGNQYMTHGGVFDGPPMDGFAHAQVVPESMYGYVRDPAGTIVGETVDTEIGGITLGLGFQVSVAGQIASINFYRPGSSSQAAHTIALWRFTGSDMVSGHELLGTTVFANVAKNGLINLAFETPIAVEAGDNLLAAVFVPRGRDGKLWYLSRSDAFWPDPVPSQWGRFTAYSNYVTPHPLNGFGGWNGMYHYGPDLTIPLSRSPSDAFYGVDPVYVASWMAPSVDVASPSLSALVGGVTVSIGTGAVDILVNPISPALTASRGTVGITTTRRVTVIPTGQAATVSRGTVSVSAFGSTTLGDASNTGVPAGTTLTPAGDIATTSAGQIIQNRDCGSIYIGSGRNNVTIRKCRISAGGWIGIDNHAGRALIEDCEIIGVDGYHGVNGEATIRRCKIHGFENGINIWGDGGGLYNSYIYDMQGGSSAHKDSIQIDGGVNGWEIAYNTLENLNDETSCCMIDNYFGPINNIDVHDNVMITGTSTKVGYTVYSDGQFTGGAITNVKYRNNRMDIGAYGYAAFNSNTPVWTGNTDRLTGVPISP